MPMREHIFKAKRKDNGEWVKGSLLTYDDGDCFICVEELKDVLNKYQVIPKTVCEYTGLTDKNGKKIFEGDILSYTNYENELQYITVVFRDYAFLIDDHGIIDPDLLKSFIYLGIEVVGNIYDNPELLEVKA